MLFAVQIRQPHSSYTRRCLHMDLNYFEAYRRVWNYHKKFSVVQDNPRYWDAVVEEFHDICEEYDRHPFVVNLGLVVIDELERINKQKGGHNGGKVK